MSVTLYSGNELPQRQPVEVDTSASFRILVLADLGAKSNWGQPLTVDCDDLDEVISRLNVRAEFELAENGPRVDVEIQRFEDFHPDQLFQNMELFKALRERRRRLLDSKSFAEELAAMRQTQPKESAPEEQADLDGASVLDQAVNLAQARQIPLEEQVLAGTVDWDDYVRQIVAPFLVQKADPLQAEMVEQIDAVISSSLRQVLHQPRFQQLEATWTGIYSLTRRLETGRSLQIDVLNVSLQALQDDLKSADDLRRSQLYQLLVESPETNGNTPWSLVVGDYQFSSTVSDCQTLLRLAKVCSAAGARCVSGASPTVAGCPSFAQTSEPDDWNFPDVEALAAWTKLREFPEVTCLALALPRILGRRVYGRETDPIESFVFEELPDGHEHESYLWMNAAYGVAILCGQAFSESGWAFRTSIGEEIDRLPIHYFEDDGAECLKACAEVYLVDRAAGKLNQLGLTVARSVRNDGAVRFEVLRSLSKEKSDWF